MSWHRPGRLCAQLLVAFVHCHSLSLQPRRRLRESLSYSSLTTAGVLTAQVTVHGRPFSDRGATLVRTVPQMPAVLDLDIDWDGSARLVASVDDRKGLPRCQELAELHSRSLTSLRVSMMDGLVEGNMLQLSGMPELRTFELLGDGEGPSNLQIDTESFAGAPQLQCLDLSCDPALHLQDGNLTQLTALTSLRLVDCGLRSVPADVASLSDTLCELFFDCNDSLQIDKAAVACIIQCSRLTRLTLDKQNIEAWEDQLDDCWESIEAQMNTTNCIPSLWSSDSVRNLVQLPSAFSRAAWSGIEIILLMCNSHAQSPSPHHHDSRNQPKKLADWRCQTQNM